MSTMALPACDFWTMFRSQTRMTTFRLSTSHTSTSALTNVNAIGGNGNQVLSADFHFFLPLHDHRSDLIISY